MAKFDYMEFTGGYNGNEFVIHVDNHCQSLALEIFLSEYSGDIAKGVYRKPTGDDFDIQYVKYFIKPPHWVGSGEFEEGCYTYCSKDTRGCFPVWILTLKDLKSK